jgi:hypothetical protein
VIDRGGETLDSVGDDLDRGVEPEGDIGEMSWSIFLGIPTTESPTRWSRAAVRRPPVDPDREPG